MEYTDAVNKMNESPTQFNMWSAISVISAVLKRNVWINRGLHVVYPNQYIVLVGPPGVGKGSAIHPAHNFVKKPPSKIPLANYLTDRITTAKLIDRLDKGFPGIHMNNGNLLNIPESSCVLQASELPTLLNSGDWITDFLCDAWDRNEYEYDTKNKGSNVIKNMCVSLIGACVPEFVKELNKKGGKAITNGFTSRAIFILGDEKSQSIVWPEGFESNSNYMILATKLWGDLESISRLKGEFHFTSTASVLFERFYKAVNIKEDDSEVVKNFKARQPTHVLKVAMCLAAGQNDTLLIDDFAISTGISLIESVLKTLDKIFKGVGDSPLAEAQARVLNYIEKKKLVIRSQILKDNYRHITLDDLDKVLYILESAKLIEEKFIGTNKWYQPTKPIP